jgi:uncharacterized protein (TIGR02246 family)
MRRIEAGIAAVALGVTLLALTASVALARGSDQAQIKALEQRLSKAVEARDIDAIMKCYAPGPDLVIFDVIPPRQYVGTAAFRKDWEGFLGSFKGPITFEVNDLSVVSGGKLAFGHSIQHISGTDKDGKKFELTMRVTDGYRKLNGKWVIAHEHSSVPVDLASGKPDLTSAP